MTPSMKRFAVFLGFIGCAMVGPNLWGVEPYVKPASIKPRFESTIDAQRIEPGLLQGIALPIRDASLKPLMAGTITKIYVQEGEWVKAGTPLLSLDDRVARAAVAVAQSSAEATAALTQAELAVKQAESQYMRTEQALRSNASSEFEVQAKRNFYEQAVAQLREKQEAKKKALAELELATAQLELLTLRAPFDGQVMQIFGKLGNSIEPNQVAVRIADLDSISVELHAPISLFGKIQSTQRLQLNAAEPVGNELTAQVKYVSPVVEPTSSTFLIRLEIANPERKLPAGFEVWLKSLSP